MIHIGDKIETKSGRLGIVVSLHWKDKKVEGYSVKMTDDPLYQETFYIPASNIKND